MKRRRNQENAKFGTYKNQTIYYRVFSAMGEIRLDLFVLQKNKKKVIGHAVAEWDDDSDVSKDAKNECKKESVRLAKRVGYPDAIGLYVKDTNIDDKYKGIGMGKAMYKLLAAILYQFLIKYPFIMMPDFCNMSYTSPEALRVWKSLAKDFPSDMSSVAGVPLPIIAITDSVPFAPLKFPLPKRKKNSAQRRRRRLRRNAEEYFMRHRPQDPSELSAPLYDLTKIYPEDVYGPNGRRYYGDHRRRDTRTWHMIHKYKGQPRGVVRMYRAIPNMSNAIRRRIKELEQLKITNPQYTWIDKDIASLQEDLKKAQKIMRNLQFNHGDWVSLDLAYAVEHGQRFDEGYVILVGVAQPQDLYTTGDSTDEWGYFRVSKWKGKERYDENHNSVAAFDRYGKPRQVGRKMTKKEIKQSLGYTNNPQPTKTKANLMKKTWKKKGENLWTLKDTQGKYMIQRIRSRYHAFEWIPSMSDWWACGKPQRTLANAKSACFPQQNPRRRKNPQYIVTLDDVDGEMLYLVDADSAAEAKKIVIANQLRPLRRGAKITAKLHKKNPRPYAPPKRKNDLYMIFSDDDDGGLAKRYWGSVSKGKVKAFIKEISKEQGIPQRYFISIKVEQPTRRKNRAARPLPQHISRTPKYKATNLYVFPRLKKYPIGDLYHARTALVFVLSPTNAKARTKVVKAVAKAYPQYNWAKWWNSKRKNGIPTWNSILKKR